MSKFMVGRQPIFDGSLSVQGYELLFADSRYSRPSADAMTADLVVHAGLDIGLCNLVGNKPVFIDATRPYLVGELEVPFAAGETVLNIPEDVPRDEEVLAGCRRLVSSGYRLAAEGHSTAEEDPLYELLSMLKLDVFGASADELRDWAHRTAQPLKLVAKGVEHHDQFRDCKKAGFHLFQGYVLSSPEVIEGRSISPNKATCLRILEQLCDRTTSAEDIAEIVKTDAGLSYRFLRLAGAGAGGGFYRQISSVREGVVLVGERRLRDWVSLMLLADLHSGSDEQLNIAMTRARMAELICQKIDPKLSEQAFTAGLISSLDLLLGCSLFDVVRGLALSAQLEDAVLGHKGLLGAILSDVIAWEVGGMGSLRSGLGMLTIAESYVEALAWSTAVCGSFESCA